MHRVVLNMQMSSDEAFATVKLALSAIPDVSLTVARWRGERHLEVVIESDDLDAVDIVREIVWEFDALATQHSVRLAEAV